MKTKKTLILAVAVLGLASGSRAAKSPSKGQKLAVVVKAGGAMAGLSAKDVVPVYLGDKQFENGERIEPLVNGEADLNDLFLKKVLNKTKAQYKKIWSGKAFIDGVSSPPVLPSSAEVLREVEKNGDAVGFVTEKDAASAGGALKVVLSVDASEK